MQLGAFDFVLKPSGKDLDVNRQQLQDELTPKIEAFVEYKRHRTKTARVNHIAENNLGTNSAIERMKSSVGELHQTPKMIGIGVSTGGPTALNRLLPKLPADFPCPILLVQHMPPKFTKSLADDLNRICALEVLEAFDGMVAKAGQILIAPGGKQMRVAKLNTQPIIQITDDPPERNCKPAVDYLFRSIAHCYGNCSIGVILTGMGDDGTIGCKLLKEAGARILTQDEESCVVYGMPRNVVEAEVSDQAASLDKIAEILIESVGAGSV